MFAADYLKAKGYKIMNPNNNKQLLISNNDIDINKIENPFLKPRIVEGVNLLEGFYGRNSVNLKEIRLEDLKRFGWVLMESPFDHRFVPFFRGQQVIYFPWQKNKQPPTNATELQTQPNDLRIMVKIKERQFRLFGQNTGYGARYKRWLPLYSEAK